MSEPASLLNARAPAYRPTLAFGAALAYGRVLSQGRRRCDAGAYGKAISGGSARAGPRGLARWRAGQGPDDPSRPRGRRSRDRFTLRHAVRPQTARRDDVCVADDRRSGRTVLYHSAHPRGSRTPPGQVLPTTLRGASTGVQNLQRTCGAITSTSAKTI